MNVPRQRHPFCPVDRCSVCLDDCEDLAQYLYLVTGAERKNTDILNDYRIWLDKHNIPAETKFGWPRPEVFDAGNINAYVRFWKE